ncbi:MAG: prolyl oligopeptidase family serine peptidase [Acidimicrobiia bacterium]|nr:prolyl oligopeptidase family serine peptidase [Acidimicrobiia bacterium]
MSDPGDDPGQRPVPLELVIGGRDLTEPRLSPDGRTVAFVQRWGGSSAIAVVPASGGPERLLTSSPDPAPGRGMGGGCFDWLVNSSGVVYAAADGELWVQPIGGAPVQLTALERSCRAPACSSDGAFVAVTIDEAEVALVDLASRLVTRLDDGSDDFCFDPVFAPDSTSVTWQAWNPPGMPWDASHQVTATLPTSADTRELSVTRLADAAIQQARFMPDGTSLRVDDTTGWANVAIAGRPIREHAEHASPTWGMGQRSFVSSPDGSRVAFARNEGGFGRLCVLDVRRDDAGGVAFGEVRDVGRGVHGQLSWVGQQLVALRSGARTPTQVVRYTTDEWDRTELAVGPAAGWESYDLPEPELMTIEHDNTTLHARRYAAHRGRMLCWVHGGPTDQWQVDFRPRIAYWWSRGWDILVVDPRGSTGHGREYQRALNGCWGRTDVADTAALVAEAHRRGWTEPQATVVIGGSSGGLTALGMLANHSDLVAGGVASYPVSDLIALAQATHRFEAHYTESLVGPVGDVERYRDLSPITKAGSIAGPLLVFHGTDDPVVPIGQSRLLVDRIRAGGGEVELVVYEGEGHGVRDPVNQRDEYVRTERFLDAVVG